ncbi:DrmB family protein [Streptomyces fenghuangensis]
MSRPYQEVRPSQFVTTFGPGSILETGSGPVVLKSMNALFNAIDRQPQDFEIVDERLSRLELDGARITRVPTNAELERSSDTPIYPTDGFPVWSLCTQHRPHQVLYEMVNGCPECPPMSSQQRREKAGREAIRFVLACESGHLDDVYWHGLVHQGGGCSTKHYLWHGGGRALRLVHIECPRCHATANFGQAYAKSWRCSGRIVEHGGRPDRDAVQCTQRARIVQRGAANLRLSLLQSALTIMDMPTRLHDVLSNRSLMGALGALYRRGLLDQVEFMAEAERAGLSLDVIEYLKQTPWTEISKAIDQLLGAGSTASSSLRGDELDRLRQAVTRGVPAVPHPHPGSPPLFEVRQGDVRHVQGPGGCHTLRVAPVSRLRMVMVQTGYQRLDPQRAQRMSTAFDWNGATWYPGIELFGEGIFIDFGDELPVLGGSRASQWSRRHLNDPDGNTSLHPVHVWWHTLSHRLLRALSLDSGYSSAAIRERVYLSLENGRVVGSGLLLYTVQPGGDGTLGGLVALVSRFENVLSYALRDVDSCSNDPLCQEGPAVGAEGAACYSCLLASETSCEHRNQGLDRLLLAENLP